jgi:hypothetical protein
MLYDQPSYKLLSRGAAIELKNRRFSCKRMMRSLIDGDAVEQHTLFTIVQRNDYK